MSITPDHFMQAAKEIADFSIEETHLRTAISRGYYWGYHSAVFEVPPDKKNRNLGMHRSYIAQLNEGGVGSFERKIGTRLNSMLGKRLAADYRLSENITTKDWELLLEAADELKGILANPPPPPTKIPPKLRVVK